ncbi:MCE family protein [Mycolicibacterium sp. jd]|jgi:phospholipid/cholesterol/gamma-HCH transport system substrate-binding protein|uniref:MCE family protein n=1 Tax=Mycolicibacterium TaxID=1866885 RepID=UPI001CA35C31|nr:MULTISPECIES: MCE family protein [Mycolicibacterium]MDW5610713.1 MCE family protein [Mycolicibacterium sp. D5.8-2]QZT58776.1 MCE family protein [Mycolicibacterium austroafricanum]
MRTGHRIDRIHPLWWTAGLFTAIAVFVAVCTASFTGTFHNYLPVTVTSDRTGLVMESGAKVKMRGVEVGRVAGVAGGNEHVSLKLELYPDKVGMIPANVEPEIKATTAFGAKYVDFVYPQDPSGTSLAPDAVLASRNVGTEVNTVFDSLVSILDQIEVPKLKAVLSAVAEGVRGKGERIGQAITGAEHVLQAVNPRMDTVAADWRSVQDFSDAYSLAAEDIMAALDAASTTSTTITGNAQSLDALLLNVTGFANSGINLLAGNRDTLVEAVNVLEPTTALLLKYNPEYTCTIQGAQIFLDKAGNEWFGGNGRTVYLDAGIAFGDDLYEYPKNLPVVAAKGGPGGKPGCGSLPDVAKNFPVRQLITDTGFGTGLDWRPNPGIGQICAADYFPVTRAIPEPPHVGRCMPGPAPGPPPAYPGGPPYGAPWYTADGTPLYPGLPEPPPPAPSPPSPPAPAAP